MGPLVKLASMFSPGLGRIYNDSVEFGKSLPRHNDNGPGDAARHAYASARVAREYGPTAAKALGALYEITSLGQDRRSQAMDEYNNARGVELSNVAPEDLREEILGMLNEGRLKTLPPNMQEQGYAKGGAVRLPRDQKFVFGLPRPMDASVMSRPVETWQPEYEKEPPLEYVSPEDFIPNPKALLAAGAKGLGGLAAIGVIQKKPIAKGVLRTLEEYHPTEYDDVRDILSAYMRPKSSLPPDHVTNLTQGLLELESQAAKEGSKAKGLLWRKGDNSPGVYATVIPQDNGAWLSSITSMGAPGEGLGRQAMRDLKFRYGTIEGTSAPDAKGFYEKIGAKFADPEGLDFRYARGGLVKYCNCMKGR